MADKASTFEDGLIGVRLPGFADFCEIFVDFSIPGFAIASRSKELTANLKKREPGSSEREENQYGSKFQNSTKVEVLKCSFGILKKPWRRSFKLPPHDIEMALKVAVVRQSLLKYNVHVQMPRQLQETGLPVQYCIYLKKSTSIYGRAAFQSANEKSLCDTTSEFRSGCALRHL